MIVFACVEMQPLQKQMFEKVARQNMPCIVFWIPIRIETGFVQAKKVWEVQYGMAVIGAKQCRAREP